MQKSRCQERKSYCSIEDDQRADETDGRDGDGSMDTGIVDTRNALLLGGRVDAGTLLTGADNELTETPLSLSTDI